jgi:Ser/Thr protein kinase RdoA (MazF antagonist)
VYRVDARQGPAVLAVYRHGRRSAAEIEAELDVLVLLADRGPASGVMVTPALRTLAGRRLLTLAAPEGPRHAVLYRFAEGAPIGRSPESPEPPASETAWRYGRLVARLHALTDDWLATAPSAAARTPLDAALLVDRSLAQIETLLGHRPADLDAIRQAAGLLRRRLAGLPLDPPGYGLVHGDVIPQNVLRAADGTLTIIDFDFCGPGWRAFDVATFLQSVGEQAPGATGADGPAFLEGYQEERPLAVWERAALPLFVAVRELFRLGNWGPRLDEWGTSALPEEHLERHLSRIQDALDRLW